MVKTLPGNRKVEIYDGIKLYQLQNNYVPNIANFLPNLPNLPKEHASVSLTC